MKIKTLVASVGALGVVGGSLALLSPSASARTLNIGNGAAEVLLSQCNDGGKAQSKTFIEGCSYTAFTNKAGTQTTYTFVSSNGNVTWKNGTIQAGALSFPAAGQTWPSITGLPLDTVSASTASDITGTVDLTTGKVVLNLKVNTLLTSGTGDECTLTGEATLTSDGTEGLGKVAKGSPYDPSTGKFAVVSTTPASVTATGKGCSGLNLLYDVSKGMGYYIAGGMTLPGGATPTPAPTTPTPTPTPTPEPTTRKAQKPTKALSLPSKLAKTGDTRLVKLPVKTNAGRTAKVAVRCTSVNAAAAGEVRACTTFKRAGAVWVNLAGTQTTKVTVRITAAGTKAYKPMAIRKVYRTAAA